VDFYVKFVDRHPILEIAVQPVGLFDQQHAGCRMRLQIGNHFAEGGAARLLGRFHIHIILGDDEALRCPVFPQDLQLRWDREPLLFLLLGRHAGVEDRLLTGGIGGEDVLRCHGHDV
jgi:hypothetical protein